MPRTHGRIHYLYVEERIERLLTQAGQGFGSLTAGVFVLRAPGFFVLGQHLLNGFFSFRNKRCQHVFDDVLHHVIGRVVTAG